jgi:glycosyltransferase involved in cell wall biosynthesis
VRVQILLSTYNGARFLAEQMDSLLAQDHPDLEILARDDGSTDGTVEILRAYAGQDPRIQVVVGENLGPVQSFFRLLQTASPSASYLALCDQDDVWGPDKVSRAVRRLSAIGEETPALYCSRLACVDADLRPIGCTPLPRRGPGLYNALVEAVPWGCTCVLNQAARRLVLRRIPEKAYLHDWWLYLVVAAFGRVVYDPEPSILYRRHAANATRVATGVLENWSLKIRRFAGEGHLRRVHRQAEEFYRIFGDRLQPEDQRRVKRFLDRRQSWWSRVRYALSPEVHRQSVMDDLLLRGLIALDRL